jgi:hypothetical protein
MYAGEPRMVVVRSVPVLSERKRCQERVERGMSDGEYTNGSEEYSPRARFIKHT